jgi:hypothetical protein
MSLKWIQDKSYTAAVVVHICDVDSSSSIDKEMTKIIETFRQFGFYTCNNTSDMEAWDNEYSRFRCFITHTDVPRQAIKEFVRTINAIESDFDVKAHLLSRINQKTKE